MRVDAPEAPANRLAERSILGGVMRAPEWLPEFSDSLKPEDFHWPEHGELWRWMLAEHQAGRAIDPITMLDRMPGAMLSRVGGFEYVLELPDRVPSTANLGHYVEVVLELSCRRRVLESCERWSTLACQPDPEGALLETVLADISKIRVPGAVRGEWVGDTLGPYIEENDRRAESEAPPFERLGWRDVDALLKLGPGDLCFVGARPGMGKSAWVLNALLWRAGKLSEVGGMFSLEMSRRQLMDRLVATRSGVELERVKLPNLRTQEQWDAITAAEVEIRDLPILIDYRSSLTIEEIRAEARRWVALHGCSVVVVDYLQLIRATDSRVSREQQIAHMSRELKNLARDLGVVVIALAQVNRACEQRNDKRPMVSDLRESGSLEQDADAICFLYRDAYYTRNAATRYDAELLVPKQRNGPRGVVHLRFYGRTQVFVDGPSLEERRAEARQRSAGKPNAGAEGADDTGKQQEIPTPRK